MTILDALKQHTVIVADTGDFSSAAEFRPEDATTNPSLINQAASDPKFAGMIKDAIERAKASKTEDALQDATDRLVVAFGCEFLKIIPGVISTEVDASLSFDVQGSVKKALRFIELYKEAGYAKDRILIKLASTWEGLEAARILESTHGIHCNMTLIFSFEQAVVAAENGATLISPFVGRIYDWYMKNEEDNKANFVGANDPGVVSVSNIYKYYKKHGYKTIVMGASFRNTSQIIELAGCDKLTVSPKLLKELASTEGTLERKLDSSKTDGAQEKLHLDEPSFRWLMNENRMASEKLSEGIRAFQADYLKLLDKVKMAM